MRLYKTWSLNRDFLWEAGAVCPVGFTDVEAGRGKCAGRREGPQQGEVQAMGQAFCSDSFSVESPGTWEFSSDKSQ